MTPRCLDLEEALAALETGPHPPLHATECAACAALLDDLVRVRTTARQLGTSAWADVPRLDVDLALRRVRARALLVPAPDRGDRAPGARVPQVLSAAAAAVLLCALVGPYALRQRVERPAGAGFRPAREFCVFWTSAPHDLALNPLVLTGAR